MLHPVFVIIFVQQELYQTTPQKLLHCFGVLGVGILLIACSRSQWSDCHCSLINTKLIAHVSQFSFE